MGSRKKLCFLWGPFDTESKLLVLKEVYYGACLFRLTSNYNITYLRE